jgi:hypothetical protein
MSYGAPFGTDAYSGGGGGGGASSTYPSYLSSGYGYGANGGLKPAPAQAGAFIGGSVPAPLGGRLQQQPQQRGHGGSLGLNPVRSQPLRLHTDLACDSMLKLAMTRRVDQPCAD